MIKTLLPPLSNEIPAHLTQNKTKFAPHSRTTSVPDSVTEDFDVLSVPAGFDVPTYMKEKIHDASLEEAFFILDLGVVTRKMDDWRQHLPRIEPSCAVKCNTHPALLRTLASNDCAFDCTSKAEVDLALEAGCSPSKIFYASPCKLPSQIRNLRSKKVSHIAFDTEAELEKISENFPEAQLILRIAAHDSSEDSLKTNPKSGAPVSRCESLLLKAQKLSLNVVGVSFDIGCIASAPDQLAYFEAALENARLVFDIAAIHGVQMTLLDIGGGFPGLPTDVPLAEIAKVLTPKIDSLFPNTVRVIAEIGRFLTAQSMSLAVQVFARREVNASASSENSSALDFLYYVNDGVYGSFSCMIFDNAKVTPRSLIIRQPNPPMKRCTIFGPTCDGIDFLSKEIEFPELNIGDWLWFENMGAYTTSEATHFNGFRTTLVFVVNSA